VNARAVLARDLDQVAGAPGLQHLRTPLPMHVSAAQLEALRRDKEISRRVCVIRRGRRREPVGGGHESQPLSRASRRPVRPRDSQSSTADSPRFLADVKAQCSRPPAVGLRCAGRDQSGEQTERKCPQLRATRTRSRQPNPLGHAWIVPAGGRGGRFKSCLPDSKRLQTAFFSLLAQRHDGSNSDPGIQSCHRAGTGVWRRDVARGRLFAPVPIAQFDHAQAADPHAGGRLLLVRSGHSNAETCDARLWHEGGASRGNMR
jgi:hypothetical protein